MKKLQRNDERMQCGENAFTFAGNKTVFRKVPDQVARDAVATGRYRVVEDEAKPEETNS